MPSPSAPLLLALSLLALPVVAGDAPAAPVAVQTPAAASAPAPAAKAAPKPRPATPAGNSTKARRTAKPATTARATPAKGTKPAADCDTPEAKVVATKPVPVAADPLAPTLVPCADPTPKS